jgi:polysaccharide chain length determinant protein (PEP-CTERM system associated)
MAVTTSGDERISSAPYDVHACRFGRLIATASVMEATARGTTRNRPMSSTNGFSQLSPVHYVRLSWHKKWLVVGVFISVSAMTAIVSYNLPDVFASETLIMVDPQKVPESYVRTTVSGDVRNRLGTLSQQILSATRLQKIIEGLNLYPVERKTLPREDVIALMRRNISVQVVSDFGASQDLQAFRIRYNGVEPRLVSQVTNELASLFIEENLKAREQQATGTQEFLNNQLEETRKTLEAQEAKLRDFKLKHIGEMPEHQATSLQILGQLQSQLQIESEALNRAEQQRMYIQSLMSGQMNTQVVDLDPIEPSSARRQETAQPPKTAAVSASKARLATLLSRYSEDHPEIRRLRRQIADEEASSKKQQADAPATPAPAPPDPAPATVARQPVTPKYTNPVLESQVRSIEATIAKHKEEQQRLSRQVAQYRARVEAIPVREQQVSELVRDYEISKAHYKGLLEKQMSAETATQLEIRQKGERFTVLDRAQPAERPSSPNRPLINAAGAVVGLGLGVLLALMTEFLGVSITAPEQITGACGLMVLEVIPVIRTHADRTIMRRRIMFGVASALLVVVAGCAVAAYKFRDQLF